jgi:hypothetical protein
VRLPKSGAKIEDSTQWLKSNISKKIINHGDIWLYVWMGTCNLTSKNKKYISLKKMAVIARGGVLGLSIDLPS